jgi:hypothetical protein
MCKHAIPGDDVNVAKDIAFCRRCNQVHSFSGLVMIAEQESGVDLSQPPDGAWSYGDGRNSVIGATHRSLGAALGALAISLFWNGIVSIFVALAVSATLQHMGIALPHWFPSPRMNGGEMGVGMTIFLWLFLTPFIAIGLAMIGAFFSALAGRTQVRIGQGEGVVFTGIGSVGYRRRFNPSEVREVRIHDDSWRDSDGDRRRKTHIIIEANDGKLIKFGSTLREDRMRFVAAAIRAALEG